MTTVNAIYTKINGTWVKSSSDVATSVKISSIASSNQGGFAVGSIQVITNSYSETTYANTGSSYGNLGSAYSAIQSVSPLTNYPPFVIVDSPSLGSMPITLTVSCSYSTNYGSSFTTMTSNGYFQAIRVSDGTVLGSCSTGNSKDYAVVTSTMTLTLPTDWDLTTDTIQFQGKSSQTSTSYGNRKYIINIANSTITTDAYYYPKAGV